MRLGGSRWQAGRLFTSSSSGVDGRHESRVLFFLMLRQLVYELGGVVAVRIVADVRAHGGVRLLVTVHHRLADGAVAAELARERLVVVVVHSMTGHVVFQRRAKRTAITAEQLVFAVVHAQVIPELDLCAINQSINHHHHPS